MERTTRKCLTYSHVHASYLRGPPTRRPLGRAEESFSPCYAEARLRLSHPSLQVAQKAPEYPGPTAGVPREVCTSCANHWTPLCAYLRLPTPTHHPRCQVGCLRPRQTGSCWRQLSATGSCGKPRFPQRRTAAGVVHTHLRFQRCAAAAAAHQIGPCHAAANE